jgi:hypothetical protein
MKVNQYFGEAYWLCVQGQRVNQRRYRFEAGNKLTLLTMKMEATFYSKKPVAFHQAIQHYIPEDRKFS